MDKLQAIIEVSTAIGFMQSQQNILLSPALAANIKGLVAVREMLRKEHEHENNFQKAQSTLEELPRGE